MAAQALPEEQLLELLLTLKRTTPAEAKAILDQQPQIAYALMTMMVNVNAVKMEVVQETLAKYGTLPGPAGASQPTAPPSIPSQPPSAIPPHMQAQMPPPRGGTPTYPSHAAGPSGGYPPQAYPSSAPPAGPSRGYGTPPPNQVPGFGTPPHAPHAPPQPPHAQGLPHAQPPPPLQLPHMSQPTPAAGPSNPQLPDALTGLPEDQKALIMRVIAMTREEVYQMPPADRENIIKLRTTLGLPT
ncbi:hypothetical protein LXA43DRAFT_884852 [Ganoderma leucocontextum]|nr:hypothetical protein LXA43DRAFT_884852 [Ganoderma leucocontextum]